MTEADEVQEVKEVKEALGKNAIKGLEATEEIKEDRGTGR